MKLHRSPGMFAIFVSHQWLGSEHPDPAGEQMQVLRESLRNVIKGFLQAMFWAFLGLPWPLRAVNCTAFGML